MSRRERVELAVKECKAKTLNIAQAARKYGIPYTTLHTRRKNGFLSDVVMGRPTALPKEYEEVIADYVKKRADSGLPINKFKLRKTLKKYVLKHTTQKGVTCSRKLVDGILARAGDITLRTPHHTTRGRFVSFNRVSATKWTTINAPVMEMFVGHPERVFNLDAKFFNALEMCRGKVR